MCYFEYQYVKKVIEKEIFMKKRYLLFIYLVWGIVFQATAMVTSSDQKNGVGTKRSHQSLSEEDVQERKRSKNLVKLVSVQYGNYPQLLISVIDELQYSDQRNIGDEVKVEWEKRSGYYFFKAQSFLWRDDSFYGRVPVSAYKAFDHLERPLAAMCKYVFPFVHYDGITDEEAVSACKRKMVAVYKIHLMPTLDNLKHIMKKLIQSCLDNHELRSLLRSFKVATYFEPSSRHDKKIVWSNDHALENLKQSTYYMPAIVLYLKPGKESAQRALDLIKEIFAADQGYDQVPRFSQKITSLISYVQGNGDDKIMPGSEEYFEEDKIHFKANFTGIEEDYKLIM